MTQWAVHRGRVRSTHISDTMPFSYFQVYKLAFEDRTLTRPIFCFLVFVIPHRGKDIPDQRSHSFVWLQLRDVGELGCAKALQFARRLDDVIADRGVMVPDKLFKRTA